MPRVHTCMCSGSWCGGSLGACELELCLTFVVDGFAFCLGLEWLQVGGFYARVAFSFVASAHGSFDAVDASSSSVAVYMC